MGKDGFRLAFKSPETADELLFANVFGNYVVRMVFHREISRGIFLTFFLIDGNIDCRWGFLWE